MGKYYRVVQASDPNGLRSSAASVVALPTTLRRMKLDSVGRAWITTDELKGTMFGQTVPETEKYRRYLGKSVNTEIIEATIRAAELGYMRDLSDLGTETLRVDPHLAGVVSKRMRAVGSIKPKVVPATGDNLDKDEAKFWADVVSRQIQQIPHFKRSQINHAWSAWHARACSEIQWVPQREPRVPWRAGFLHWIHPRRCALGPEREIRINDSLYQGTGFDTIGFDTRELPFKFITSRRQLFNEYPEREGLIIPSIFYSYFKRFGWRERLALLELYGKPLRWIETDVNAPHDPGALDEAKNTADDMGSDAAAALPPGMKLMVQAVGRGANEIHKEIIEDCNSELSKLVLGSTNTTDSQGGGLGSGQAYVHQDGETLVFTTDCDETAEDLTTGLARNIVLLNAGEEVADLYTPTIELAYELPPDPKTELERAKLFFDMRLPLKRTEIYERGGFSEPTDAEDVVEPPALPAEPVLPQLDAPLGAMPGEEVPHPQLSAVAWRRGRVRLTAGETFEVIVQDVPIVIDRPRGFVQTGVSESGQPWSRTYSCDYGYIPNTQGGDGEGLDVFLGGSLDRDTVFWVKQTKTVCGSCGFSKTDHALRHTFQPSRIFDEYKLFIGFASATEALDCYAAHIPTDLFAGLESTTIEQLKAALGITPKARIHNSLALKRAEKVLGIISLLHDEVRG